MVFDLSPPDVNISSYSVACLSPAGKVLKVRHPFLPPSLPPSRSSLHIIHLISFHPSLPPSLPPQTQKTTTPLVVVPGLGKGKRYLFALSILVRSEGVRE